MTWFRIDDKFGESRKVRSIPRAQRMAAIGLWTMAGQWSAGQLTDGEVPAYMIEEFGGNTRLARALVDCGLWHEVPAGYLFHDWADWQPTREQVEHDRAAARERMAKLRNGSGAVRPNSTRTAPEVQEQFATPVPTRPNQELPTEVPEDSLAAKRRRFDEFWTVRPSRGKGADNPKAPAKKLWDEIVRKVDPQVIIDAARRWASNVEGKDPQFTPQAVKWLRNRGWEDDEERDPALPTEQRGSFTAPPLPEDAPRSLFVPWNRAHRDAWLAGRPGPVDWRELEAAS